MNALRRRLALTAWVALAAALGGCAALRQAPPADLVGGRLAVSVPATDQAPARSLQAGFELAGDAERGQLRLVSPLGSVLGQASWAPGMARLVTPDGDQRYGSVEELAREAVGEPIPLQALPDWLRGRPWAGAPSVALEPPRGPGFEQLGWRVDLASFARGLVVATRPSSPPVTVRAALERP